MKLKLHLTRHIAKVELHNRPLCIPKSSAATARIRLLVRSCSSFDFWPYSWSPRAILFTTEIGGRNRTSSIDGKISKSLQLFSVSDHGVDLPEPTAISKSCQRPKRKSWEQHLHFAPPTNLKFRSFLPIARRCYWHKSHLRRGGRTWYPECNKNYPWLDILEI